MSTLCMSQCDPPFEKSWLRLCTVVTKCKDVGFFFTAIIKSSFLDTEIVTRLLFMG